MTVNIEINDEQLKTLAEEGLKALDSETMGSIFRDALVKYLEDPNVIDDLVFERGLYGSRTGRLNQDFVNIFSKTMTPDDMSDVKNTLLDSIKKNHREILEDVLVKALTNALFTYENQEKLTGRIMEMVRYERNH